VVAKVEWHQGELYPRVGFIVTNLKRPAESVSRFYNRGTAEQWIREGKHALRWTTGDQQAQPSDHPNLATGRENYAVLLDALGRSDEAAALRAQQRFRERDG
jgi:hypothetical protein